MGEDGVRGLVEVRAMGGTVLVQSPASCVVPGMPEAAMRADLVHAALAPEGLVEAIASSLTAVTGARA